MQSIVNNGLQHDIAAYTSAHGPQKAALKQRVDGAKTQLRNRMQDAAPPDVVSGALTSPP